MVFLGFDFFICNCNLIVGQSIVWQVFDVFVFKDVVVDCRLLVIGSDGFFFFWILDYKVCISFNQNCVFFGIVIQDFGDIG